LSFEIETGSEWNDLNVSDNLLVYKGVAVKSSNGIYLDTATLHDTLLLAEIPLSITAGQDTGRQDISISSTRFPNLYTYIKDTVLNRPSDTAVVGLVLMKKSVDTHGSILTIVNRTLPSLKLFGYYRPSYQATVNDTPITYHPDSLKLDSVLSFLRVMSYSASTDTTALPVLSSVYYQTPYTDSTDTGFVSSVSAGILGAVFKVSREAIFGDLNPDSINILKASALFTNNLNASMSDQNQAMDISLRCLFFDSLDNVLSLTGGTLFNKLDTLVYSFSPDHQHELFFPIDKYLALLTDPRYKAVKTVEFYIAPNPEISIKSSLHRLGRVEFLPQIQLSFDYSRR